MVFSDTSTNQGILQEIDFLAGTDSTSYPTSQKTRNINRAYEKVASIIQMADGKWEWEDLNNTDLPIATTTVTINVQDYQIPSTFLKVKQVFYLNDGVWQELKFVNDKTEFLEVISTHTGVPSRYTLLGNSILLDVLPQETIAAALKVHYARDISTFVTTDTTKTPGFATQFHRYLSLSPAYDYAIAKGKGNATQLRNEMLTMEKGISSFYAGRQEVVNVRARPAKLERDDFI